MIGKLSRPKPKVDWNHLEQQWEVTRGGKFWYGSKDWREAIEYAILLSHFQPKDYSLDLDLLDD